MDFYQLAADERNLSILGSRLRIFPALGPIAAMQYFARSGTTKILK